MKLQNFRTNTTKRRYVYLRPLRGAAKAKLTRPFLARKPEEYDALRVEIERLQKASEWTS